jgi:calcineurin-like phosphoesterase family protein
MKLTLENGQKVWFTSDTHYSHANICRATTKWGNSLTLTRDFGSLDQMNSALVNNINSLVGENDHLVHLGDWSFGGFEKIAEFRNRIVCKNIHLVLGNHDHHIERNKGDIQELFSSVQSYLKLDLRIPNGKLIDKIRIICMHFPIASWDGMNEGIIHLHGHTHLPPNKRISPGKSMDVGVDGNGLKPISLNSILNLMEKRSILNLVLPQDHHIED